MPLIPRSTRWCYLALVLLVVSFAGTLQAVSLHITDLQGHPVEHLTADGTEVVVLIFAATDCPISNRYIPQIEALHRELSSRGIAIWWVFPNPGDTLAVVRKHAADFSISTPTLLDSQQDLVQMAHVSVTPEAAVFKVDHGKLAEAYRGRIDDRYIAFGQERPQAAHHDLEQAIQAILAGRAVAPSFREPVGCSIIPAAQKP